jgi:two-component sensor histidine kinase
MQAKAAGKAGQPLTNAEVRLMLDGVAARIATIGQLHRLLAHMQGEGAVALNAHLGEICASLIGAFSSEQQPVKIEHGGGDCVVLLRHVQPLTLIVCEIVTNALKYSHPAGAPVHLVVHCEPHSDGTLELTVSDDGVGLPEGFDPKTDGGLGFQVIRALCGEINASLEVTSDTLGVTFRLIVPDALVANVKTA